VTDVTLVHRDERCVAVDKPSGVATHRGWDDSEDALLQRVRDAVGVWVYPVHRLDRGASGIVLFALDQEAARAFSEAWSSADKRYQGPAGAAPPGQAVPATPVPVGGDGEGVEPVTGGWRPGTFGRYALVEARPLTGRLHQIRRHLKHISCPLIGDVRYGKGEHNRIWRDQYDLHRLALHSISLRVAHPDGGELAVRCPLAADMTAAIARARAALDQPTS